VLAAALGDSDMALLVVAALACDGKKA
jgi:hypothetical protein